MARKPAVGIDTSKRLAGAAVAAFAAAICSSCTVPDDSLARLQERGAIRMGTMFGPLSYYIGPDGPQGPEYELGRAFADRQKLKLQVTAYPDLASLQKALLARQIDFAAAHLTIDSSWGREAVAAQGCYDMPQVFVTLRGRKRPKQLTDLAGLRLLVADRSPQLQRALQINIQVPTLKIVTRSPSPERQWYDDLTADIADVALVDAADFALARNVQTKLVDAFGDLQARPVQWIVRSSATSLTRAIDDFCADVGGNDLLAQTMQRTLPAGRRTKRVPAAEFRALQETRLPQLFAYFQEAAAATGLDWRLIAALAYQESQWDPLAVSPNGALGLMMLMPATARSLKVGDPMDARDSILGGARYLADQLKRLPARIGEPDRSLFALASYNTGYGHLEDARKLTQQNGGNPDVWADVKKHLPLLEQEYWYSRSENGYARGSETIGLVENVRQYRALLADYVPPPFPLAEDAESDAMDESTEEANKPIDATGTPSAPPASTPAPATAPPDATAPPPPTG